MTDELHSIKSSRIEDLRRPAWRRLQTRWRDLFAATFDILLYDLTSTYFESDPPEDEEDKRRFGHSRDKRRDCVQVVIALIVTPAGFHWPMRSCQETLPTTPRCAPSCRRSRHNTARRNGFGLWIAASPPNRCSARCAIAIHLSPILLARRRDDSPSWRRA
jgi:hypothetical protein